MTTQDAAAGQANIYLGLTTPFGPNKLLLTRMIGEEAISDLFRFSLDMVSTDRALAFDTIVGKSVTVRINTADGNKRYINGIVTRFVQAGEDANFCRYYAEVRPWLWLLTRRADCKIFQNKTTPQILEAVFGDVEGAAFRNDCTKTYQPREYCVQYNETAFAFVSRLMEEEGIFYFFEHADGKHTLVLADDASKHADCPSSAKPTYKPGTARAWGEADLVTDCRIEQQVVTGSYDVEDYNFETPATDLKATVSGAGTGGRIYEYPAGHTTVDKGSGKARVWLEALELEAKLMHGASLCRGFVAGYKFTLSGHFRQDVNAAWVLRRVVHEATLDGYSNTFEAFPADVPFRPARRTPKPRIAGSQTAVVVGPQGKEIWTDKYGRIKVQFHWDQVGTKNDQSSCWIRCAQNWAGKSWGFMFIPRIGQEVVVSFLDGDPDRPLVTGAVYNGTQTVPYTLPDEQTKSTIKTNTSPGGGGYNEIRFEDKKGSEELYVQAEKDMKLLVKNDRTKTVQHDETNTIKNNRTTTIQEGNESLTVSNGNRTIKVEKGNETHTVAGTRSVTVTKAETHTNSDSFKQEVTKDYTLKVSGNLTIDVTGSVTIKSASSITIKAGTSLTNEAGTSLTNKAGTSLTNEAQMSLTNKANMNIENNAVMQLTNKGGTMQTVDGGGMLVIKGGMVKIN